MADDLTFLMGKFPAVLPGDLRYARNHMWLRPVASGVASAPRAWRFGFTSYAVRLMQDVYFLDWVHSGGDQVELLQQIGHIETSKAVSDLFAPMAGTIAGFNQELLNDPTPINLDHYGAGWLFEMTGEPSEAMTATEYHAFLAANWEKTQRLIKGKINTED